MLDFTPLTDDQLIDLIRSACVEAASRNIAAAAQNAMLDEAEKARIAKAAINREAARKAREEADRIEREAVERAEREIHRQKIAAEWELKDELDRRLHGILHSHGDYTVTVWNKTDKRVYIAAGAKFGNNAVEYFADGNSYNKPGSLKLFPEHEPRRQEILELCQWLCNRWKAFQHDSMSAPGASKDTCTHPACVASCAAKAERQEVA